MKKKINIILKSSRLFNNNQLTLSAAFGFDVFLFLKQRTMPLKASMSYLMKNVKKVEMSSLIIISFFTLSPPMFSQNTVKTLEYWMDGNSGNRTKQIISASSTYNWEELINCSSISDGVHTFNVRFSDDGGIWTPVESFFFLKQTNAAAQTVLRKINALEYCIDTNPSDLVHLQLTASAKYNWEELIDCSSISDGVHTFNVRFSDDGGIWTPVESFFFLKQTNAAAQTVLRKINALEYCIDTNPSDLVHLQLTASAKYNWEELINCSSILDGVHTFNVRFSDDGGIWTPVESFFFLKQTNAAAQTVLRKINALEYCIDNNLSEIVQRQLTASKTYHWEELIDCSTLQDGVHLLGVRFRDDGGLWTSVQSQFFLKYSNNSESGTKKVNELEYWIDGNSSSRTNKALTASNTYVWEDLVDVDFVNQGLHSFNARFKDNFGVWTNVQSYFFFKNKEGITQVGENKITGYRIWYSEEPDYIGNFEVTSSGMQTDVDDSISVNYLPKGKYQIAYQIKDARNVWSPVITDSITQNNNPVFSFIADKREIMQGESVKFTPSTQLFIDSIVWNFGDGFTEVNYTPEHKYDSIGNFDVSATVWHRGTNEGVSYVEIKYINVTATGIFSPKIYSLKMYPVPVQNELTIESPSAQMKLVKLLSLNGTILKQEIPQSQDKTTLNMDSFPAGTYIVVVQTDKGFMSNKILKK